MPFPKCVQLPTWWQFVKALKISKLPFGSKIVLKEVFSTLASLKNTNGIPYALHCDSTNSQSTLIGYFVGCSSILCFCIESQKSLGCLSSKIPLVMSQILESGKCFLVIAKKFLQLGFKSGSPPVKTIKEMSLCVICASFSISFSNFSKSGKPCGANWEKWLQLKQFKLQCSARWISILRR